jgi:hypothetical protein
MKRTASRFALVLLTAAATLASYPALASVTGVGPGVHAPEGMYGNCTPSGIYSIGKKSNHVKGAGHDPDKVAIIDVLDCHEFDGPGGTHDTPCPVPGYTYCVVNQNDGGGNHILLGVVEDTTPPLCAVVDTRQGAVDQIDILVRDTKTDVNFIEFRGGVSNASLREYERPGTERGQIIITATKLNKASAATVGQFIVSDDAGNSTTCGPYGF